MTKKSDRKVVIEKNIPIILRGDIGAIWKRTVEKMRVGDSVLLSKESEVLGLRVAGKRKNMKFSQRKISNGIRVWRISNRSQGEK